METRSPPRFSLAWVRRRRGATNANKRRCVVVSGRWSLIQLHGVVGGRAGADGVFLPLLPLPQCHTVKGSSCGGGEEEESGEQGDTHGGSKNLLEQLSRERRVESRHDADREPAGAAWWLRSWKLHSIARGWGARRLRWRLLRGGGSVCGSDVGARTGDGGGSGARAHRQTV
jgi:hypothetical protein